MSKIIALYHNEMIKLSHQLLVWTLCIIMCVVAALSPLFNYKMNLAPSYMSDKVDKASITAAYDSSKEKLGDPNRFVNHSTIRIYTQNDIIELFATYYDFGSDEEKNIENATNYINMSLYSAMLVNYDFDRYPINDTALSLNAYREYESTFRSFIFHNEIPFAERDGEWYKEYCSLNHELELARSALYNHSYPDFVEALKLRNDSHSSQQSHALDIVQKMAEIDENGEMNVAESLQLENLLQLYFEAQDNLLKGVEVYNDSYIPLTDSRRAEMEDAVKILEYQIAHHSFPSSKSATASESVMFGISAGRFILIVLTIIIAGSSISGEIASGSIKSLIIAPVKRWKIFVAKLLAILTWILAGGFLTTLIATLSVGFTHGFSSLLPYYYVSGGAVKSLPFLLFAFLHFLVSNIEMLIYVLVAFVISCLSKNSGAACGLATALIMSNSLITFLLGGFTHFTWIDFLPVSNMDITPKVFSHLPLCGHAGLENGLLSSSASASLSLRFSTIYLIILTFTLLWIAYDGFVRKDIQ